LAGALQIARIDRRIGAKAKLHRTWLVTSCSERQLARKEWLDLRTTDAPYPLPYCLNRRRLLKPFDPARWTAHNPPTCVFESWRGWRVTLPSSRLAKAQIRYLAQGHFLCLSALTLR
jgi:hypothetical protein